MTTYNRLESNFLFCEVFDSVITLSAKPQGLEVLLHDVILVKPTKQTRMIIIFFILIYFIFYTFFKMNFGSLILPITL